MKYPLLHSMAAYCADLSFSELSETDIIAAKRCVLDYLAASAAGYSVNTRFNEAAVYAIGAMKGVAESTVMFYGDKLPAANAAFLNGVIVHGADMDDGFRTAQGHPGASIISAVFAVAEANKASGEDIITGIVVGYEVFAKLGTAINPHHALSGFHSTGTVGTVASAAAAGRVMKLSKEKMLHALGFGCMQAAGLLEIVDNGQQAKPVNTGRAAQSGVLSALLADAGAEAPESILEGKKGFLNAFSEDIQESESRLVFYGKNVIDDTYFKIYPSCRHTHGAADLALECRQKLNGYTGEIAKVIISLYPIGVRVAGNIAEPDSEEQAKFSVRYITATALVLGKVSLAELNVNKTMDSEIRRLISVSEIREDSTLEDKDKGIRGAGLTVLSGSGEILFEKRIDRPFGENPNPIPWQGLCEKFSLCAENVLETSAAEEIASFVHDLEKKEKAYELFSKMQLHFEK